MLLEDFKRIVTSFADTVEDINLDRFCNEYRPWESEEALRYADRFTVH